jgi:hypothetical protein
MDKAKKEDAAKSTRRIKNLLEEFKEPDNPDYDINAREVIE